MDTALAHMFHLGLPMTEKILRPVIVYIFLIAGLRLAGKRELAQLNPFDLVVLLTLSNTVQNAIIGDDVSITGGLIGAGTLLVANHFLVRFMYSHEGLGRLIEGKPTTLIDNGAIKLEGLRKELVTKTELTTAAHKQGFGTLNDIQRAVLDPGGSFTFETKEKTTETERHAELLARLDRISGELAALRHTS
jgi:uncharacterized membrane protein YcaP (DUF421 family)